MEKITLGEFLQKLRKENNLTQEEAADKLYVSNRTLSSWETGRTEPDINSLKEISKLYKITIDELVRCEKNFNENSIQVNNKSSEINNEIFEKESHEKFTQKQLIFSISGYFCELIAMIGFLLMTFTSVSMIFDCILSIIGISGEIIFLILLCNLENNTFYLQTENINKLKIKHAKTNSISFFIFSIIYLLFSLIIINVLIFNKTAFTVSLVSKTYFSFRKEILIIALINLFIALSFITFSIIHYILSIKKYGNEQQLSLHKKNVKLIRILSIILILSNIVPLFIYGPIISNKQIPKYNRVYTENEKKLISTIDEFSDQIETCYYNGVKLDIPKDYSLNTKYDLGNDLYVEFFPTFAVIYLKTGEESYSIVKTANSISISKLGVFHLYDFFYHYDESTRIYNQIITETTTKNLIFNGTKTTYYDLTYSKKDNSYGLYQIVEYNLDNLFNFLIVSIFWISTITCLTIFFVKQNKKQLQ